RRPDRSSSPPSPALRFPDSLGFSSLAAPTTGASMILYGAPMPAPNPRRVRIFLAERGIDLPETPLDIMKREHKSDDHRARNSLGQVPTLVLDDGTAISET